MTNRYNIDDGNGNTIDNMNENWKQEYLGIEYAPRKCGYFCCGDCLLKPTEDGYKSCNYCLDLGGC